MTDICGGRGGAIAGIGDRRSTRAVTLREASLRVITLGLIYVPGDGYCDLSDDYVCDAIISLY